MDLNIFNAVSDGIKSLFGVIDKLVPDRDKANELKVAVALAESNSKFWLAACWRPMAMLGLTGMIITLEIMGREIPEWGLVVVGLGLVGHLLTRENIKAIRELKGKK